jgi:hypothetical protein
VSLESLPIGAGESRTAWRPLTDAEAEEYVERAVGTLPPPPPPPTLVEVPRVEVIEWDSGRLRQPLKLVGKTVNWQVRRRTGLETEAGVMTEENLQDIGEPLAEVFNRYEPTRALAARSAELNLALAVWDYAHDTAHKAARDQLLARESERAVAQPAAEEALSRIPMPLTDEGEVPVL